MPPPPDASGESARAGPYRVVRANTHSTSVIVTDKPDGVHVNPMGPLELQARGTVEYDMAAYRLRDWLNAAHAAGRAEAEGNAVEACDLACRLACLLEPASTQQRRTEVASVADRLDAIRRAALAAIGK